MFRYTEKKTKSFTLENNFFYWFDNIFFCSSSEMTTRIPLIFQLPPTTKLRFDMQHFQSSAVLHKYPASLRNMSDY